MERLVRTQAEANATAQPVPATKRPPETLRAGTSKKKLVAKIDSLTADVTRMERIEEDDVFYLFLQKQKIEVKLHIYL